MRRIQQLFWDTKWTAATTALIAVLFGHVIFGTGMSLYNAHMPVVKMTGSIVHKTDNSVLLHITGSKMRNCRFVRVNAMYTFHGNGMLVDAFIERTDGPPIDGATKPIGEYDLGFWRVWPTDNADKVVVFVHHECGGETVLSKIAEVTL